MGATEILTHLDWIESLALKACEWLDSHGYERQYYPDLGRGCRIYGFGNGRHRWMVYITWAADRFGTSVGGEGAWHETLGAALEDLAARARPHPWDGTLDETTHCVEACARATRSSRAPLSYICPRYWGVNVCWVIGASGEPCQKFKPVRTQYD